MLGLIVGVDPGSGGLSFVRIFIPQTSADKQSHSNCQACMGKNVLIIIHEMPTVHGKCKWSERGVREPGQGGYCGFHRLAGTFISCVRDDADAARWFWRCLYNSLFRLHPQPTHATTLAAQCKNLQLFYIFMYNFVFFCLNKTCQTFLV